MSANLFNLLFIALFVNSVFSGLVPRIQDNSVQLEPLGDNKYTLRFVQLGAVREENVELVAPGEFLIKGKLEQKYVFPSGKLIVTYEAGRNGYRAKYSFISTKGEEMPVILGLSPNALKSAAG